jgi:6-phospho-beta-glucosidase
VRATADLHRGLDGADFVVAQIRVGGQAARMRDETLGIRFGLLGQETTGVSGFVKALRTVPELLQIARAIEKHAPKAVLVNFTNPVSIVTEAILKETSVTAIGLCNIPIGLRIDLANLLGIDPSQVTLDSVGLNHLSFVRRVLVDGKDVLPGLLASVTGPRENRPVNIPELDFPPAFLAALGMVPSDYLKYFFLQRESIAEQARKTKTRAEEVMEVEEELLAFYANEANVEKPPSLSKRGGAFYSHAALEVIDAIVHDTGAELVVDVQGRGAVGELPPDAVVEVPCTVNRRGALPLAQRPLEPAIRGIIAHVKAYEELAVRAAVHKERSSAILALAAHPLVPSVSVAVGVVDEIARELGLS